MDESYDGTDRPINPVEPHYVKDLSRVAFAGEDQSSDHSPANCEQSIHTDRPYLPRLPSPTHASSPSECLFATTAVLRDNEPGEVACSMCTSEGSRGPIPQKCSSSSCKGGHSSFDCDKYGTCPPSLLGGFSEHPPSGFQSYNPAATGSNAEAHSINSPRADTRIEDDILKRTIPVVRDILQGAAKGLDAYLPPRDNIVVNSAPQLDARGSSFNDVGGDQHYHVHVTFCPHASSSTTHHSAETANVADIGPEPSTFALLLECGYKLMTSARTFITMSVAAVTAQFRL